MQTNLADPIRHTPEGKTADEIIRRCVHCGICNAVCPTYRLSGNEADGPRGRIYQIKQLLENEAPAAGNLHRYLDHCLTCRACESVCPAKVEYGKLAEIGRDEAERRIKRPLWQKLQRGILRRLITAPQLFTPLYRIGQHSRPLLPDALKNKILPLREAGFMPDNEHPRQILMLEGCVQPALSPNINRAAARILDRLGIQTHYSHFAGCCGAVNLHNGAKADGLDDMRRNIEAWIPWLPDGIEAVVTTASGCGVTVKDYAYHLQNDPEYAERAARISALSKDIVEILSNESHRLHAMMHKKPSEKIAYHPPCTQQYGQKLSGSVENLFAQLGIPLYLPANSGQCCGAAGTYALLQPQTAGHLKTEKLTALNELQPDIILSANIGCIAHLGGGKPPVRHWIEYLDELLA